MMYVLDCIFHTSYCVLYELCVSSGRAYTSADSAVMGTADEL